MSPDGRRLAAGSADAPFIWTGGPADTRIVVWDAESGEQVAVLPGSVNGHRCVAFSPDGRTLTAGGEDHAAYVWELASGGMRTKLVGHEGPVTAVKFARTAAHFIPAVPTRRSSNGTWRRRRRMDRATAWVDLRVSDAMKAHRALHTLLISPADTVATLSRKLKKSLPVDETSMKKWIDDLDSPKFAAREAASKKLVRVAGPLSRFCVKLPAANPLK